MVCRYEICIHVLTGSPAYETSHPVSDFSSKYKFQEHKRRHLEGNIKECETNSEEILISGSLEAQIN
jgi:hypothetical protein